ncbi:MAG: hypothetical protein JNL82_29665 [Myxococcales bacterium]|nr:hypothetical protein [Myxococcales bacterium]
MRGDPNRRAKALPVTPRATSPLIEARGMGCNIIPILRRKAFDWSYLAAGGQQQVLLQAAIPTANFYYVQLWIRVHALSFSDNQVVGVALYDTFPSEDDAREFTKTSSTFASTSYTSSVTPPALLSASGTGPGPFLKALLIGYQATAVAGTFYTELSVSLVVRSTNDSLR